MVSDMKAQGQGEREKWATFEGLGSAWGGGAPGTTPGDGLPGLTAGAAEGEGVKQETAGTPPLRSPPRGAPPPSLGTGEQGVQCRGWKSWG